MLNWTPVADAAWFGLPRSGWPGLDLSFDARFLGLLVPFVIVTIIGAIETYGHAIAIQRVSHRTAAPVDGAHRIISMRKPMNGNERSTAHGSEPDIAPDLSTDGWPEKFARATVRRGRPPSANPKVSTTIRLSRDVIEHFRAGGRGWQTRIDAALREWIAKHDVA